MTDKTVNQPDQPVKRFNTYEEFAKEFYPKEEEQEKQQRADSDGEFGIELAFDSLNRHAAVLRFRENA